MHIAHVGSDEVHPLHRFGGASQRRILETARLQTDRGHQVAVYGVSDRNAVRTGEYGFELRTVRCLSTGPARRLEFLARAALDLRRRRPDIVHFHSNPEGAITIGGTSRTVLQYDYYVFMRGKFKPLYRAALRKFDRLLPVSQYCQKAAIAYWDIPDVPSEVLYNGVNVEQFSPDPISGNAMRLRLALGDSPVVLYIGRICEQKGTPTLIRAFDLLRTRIPSARLVIAGPAERFGRSGGTPLTGLIEQAGGLYLGAIEERELSAVYNMCDVFVMPTVENEMFGMAAAEAQACGKPVICSRHGGLMEVVSERSGLFFAPGDAVALAANIELLLTDRVLRQSLGEKARESIMSFSWPKIVDQLDRIYRDVADRVWLPQCAAVPGDRR